MPHQISAATGCTQKDAMVILMLLYHENLTEPFLVVYHVSDPDTPMIIRKFEEGPPSVPFSSPLDEKEITSSDELTYDFLFKLPEGVDIRFVFEDHESD